MLRSWLGRTLALLMFAFLAAATSCASSTPNPIRVLDDYDPDDRPPIIVYNGTIQFRATSGKGEKAKWDPQSTTGPWFSTHSNGTPKWFIVQMIAGVSGKCLDTKQTPPQPVDEVEFDKVELITIKFVNGTANGDAVIKVDGTGANAKTRISSDNTAGSATGDLLTFGEPGSYITSVALEINGNRARQCNFESTGPGLLVIKQKNK